jgi:4'-phosphopantetheinyl transferase
MQDCCASEDAAVRRERVLARALVRSVLAGYLPSGTPPRSLLFEKNMHGKPRLLWPASTPSGHMLRFNLTHTSTLIGLAVSGGGPA